MKPLHLVNSDIQMSLIFAGTCSLALHSLECQKHINSSQHLLATASSFHQDPASFSLGVGYENPVSVLLALGGPLFQVFFPVQWRSTIFQELIECHMQRDPDKHLRSKSVQVLQTQSSRHSSPSLSLWAMTWAHGRSNGALEAPVGFWTSLVSYQILWYNYITTQCFCD